MDASKKSPAFQFYPKDFLSDEKQIRMSLAAVGIYMRLLCHCWNEGSLPSDAPALARLSGATTRQLRALWPSISPCFQTTPDGRLVNARLNRERTKQTLFSSAQRSRIEFRWRSDQKAKAPESFENSSMSDADGEIRYPSGNTKAGNTKAPYYSSSSSSSSSAIKNKYTPPANLSVSQEIAEKAARFLERYVLVYAEERRGAHFALKPVLHFQTACELVQGWPDLSRLELMLRTFCKLPASEKMAWPGTPAQFKHLAPSIDARLRQAGV